MNYLAHVYLADRVNASLTGNLMGDFVRGRLQGDFPPAIEYGLWMHRQVDVFTDAHPVTRTSRRRFAPPFRRYAGILVDLFYDHCLARDWAEFHDDPLEDFAARVYAALARDERFLVEPLRSTHDRLRQHDVLTSYARLAGVQSALENLHRRLRRTNPLAEAVAPLQENYTALHADFREFMPSLMDFVASGCKARHSPTPGNS